RRVQLAAFVHAVVDGTVAAGVVGMPAPMADVLAAFRSFNYEHIYLRPASRKQAGMVIDLLQALVEHYADRPPLPPVDFTALSGDTDGSRGPASTGWPEAYRAAVTYVGGMTDRYACRLGITELGWDASKLPVGVDFRA